MQSDPTPAEDARAALTYSATPTGDAPHQHHAARAARLARAYEHLQRNLTLLSQAISHRSTQAIRDRFKGNTPEIINGETDELTVLFAEFEEQAREVERLRTFADIADTGYLLRVEGEMQALRADLARVTQEAGKIVEKCRQYANAPRLCVEEQHAVLEWIERAALRAAEQTTPAGPAGGDNRED